MRTIAFTAPKGGQGTTTVAAATAVFAADHGTTTFVTTHAHAIARLLGAPAAQNEPVEVAPQLWVASQPVEGSAVAVVDHRDSGRLPEASERFAVVRGPCYLALAALLEQTGPSPDGIVLVAERGRSLTERDVVEVTGLPVVATVAVSDAVARTIDAGLLLARLHKLPELRSLRTLAASTDPPNDRAKRTVAALRCQRPTNPSSVGTDLPCPQSGHRGDRVPASETVRESGPSMHVYRVWNVSGRRDAEHRQARARCRRLLRGRGRHLGRGLLHRAG